ncbi:MAG: MFS transporter, partial [Candidatus Omnitrophica bacterium]|nr:MFS transporter [Candidatus Omnitrophota bacterium]
MLLAYLNVLKKRNFFLLWFSQIISQFGDRLTQMALIGLVYKVEPLSTLGMAKMMSLSIVPVFIVSPLAGVYVDRWDNRKTMAWSDFLRGIFILLIPIVFGLKKFLLLVYLLIFLSFCVGCFFITAKMSLIPKLVEEKNIFMANSLVSTTAMSSAVLGWGLGGIIVERWGLFSAFVIDALTFFISAIAIYFIKIKRESSSNQIIELGKETLRKLKHSFVSDIKDGLDYIFRSPQARYASKIFFVLFSSLGAIFTVFVVFIQNTLSSITLDLGILSIGGSSGLLLGTLLYGRLGFHLNTKKVINMAMALFSLYLILFVYFLRLYPSKIFAFVSCFLLGLIISPVEVAIRSIIHRDSQDKFLGRIFSSLEMLIHTSLLFFMFISSY